MSAAQHMGQASRAARGPALHQPGRRQVEVQVPGGGGVPVEVGAGVALGEQHVEHLGGTVLATVIEGREYRAQACGEPLQTGGLLRVDLGVTRPRLAQRLLRAGLHLFWIAEGRHRPAAGLGRGECVDEGHRHLDGGGHMTVEVNLTSHSLGS